MVHGRLRRRGPARRWPLAAAALVIVAASLAAGAAVAEDRSGACADPFLRPLSSPRAEIWAVGDGADGSARSAAVADWIARAEPDRFLYLGDVYEQGTAAEFARNYHPSWGRLAPVTAPTLGNHEAANAAVGYRDYWRAQRGSAPPDFYALRVGRWRVLSLNSEIAHGPRSAQMRWLRGRLRAGGTCRIAFWHRPRFSAGVHGNARDARPLWRALAGRARIVIGGHDHNLQRFRPRGGLVQIVAGAGGRARTPVDRARAGLRFANDLRDGAVRLRLRGRSARIEFLALGGEVLDSTRVRCRRAAD